MKNYIIPFDEIMPEFCKIRNLGSTFFKNGNPDTMTPRINFIIGLLDQLNLEYEIDSFQPFIGRGSDMDEVFLYNIYLKGSSDVMVMAHHDVMNYKVDNCNDNTASIVNAIATKVLNPNVNVAITDGEEVGGHGCQRVCNLIHEGVFGEIKFIANLELSACGGTNFFTEPYSQSELHKKIFSLFPNTPQNRVPFHDGVIARRNKIDSLVINPLPLKEDGTLNYQYLYYCHTEKDTISLANYDDMDIFVREIITPIIS